MADLQSVDAKIARAREHLDVFSNEMMAYLKSCHHDVSFGVDAKLAKAEIIYSAKPDPPMRLGIIVADCVHNLRSALDNLVCALVRIKKVDSKCSSSQFLACISESDYLERRKSALKGIPTGAAALMDELQPYTTSKIAPDIHPLVVLNKLSNADKHRAPVLTAAYSHKTRLVLEDDAEGVFREVTLAAPMRSGANIIVKGVPSTLKEGMKMHAYGTTTITFHDPSEPWDAQPVDELLSVLIGFVSDNVINRFRLFF